MNDEANLAAKMGMAKGGDEWPCRTDELEPSNKIRELLSYIFADHFSKYGNSNLKASYK
jgi:hypothetical protein